MHFAAALLTLLASPELPILPVDPVELILTGREVPGEARWSADHLGLRYRFASAANREAFLGAPARFGAQLGGACARMGPLSGRAAPTIFAVHEDALYLFASEACREGFLAAPERLLPRDEAPPLRTESGLKRGAELVDLALAGLGGAERVDGARSLAFGIDREEDGATVWDRWTIEFGAGLARSERWGEWRRESRVARSGEWFVERGEPRPMAPAARRELLHTAYREPLVLLRARRRADFVAVGSGTETVDGYELELLTIGFDGANTTLGIEADTGRVRLVRYLGRGPSAAFGSIERIHPSFREVGGLTLPDAWVVRCDGREVAKHSRPLTRLAVDVEVEPARFAPPDGVLDPGR